MTKANIIPHFIIIFSNKHILIGGFSKRDLFGNSLASTSHLYITDYATWCIAAAEKQSSWKNIFYIFSNQLWSIIAITFVIIILVIFVFAKIERKKHDYMWAFMYSVKVNIGFMPGFIPKKFFARIIVFMLLLYGLISSTLFQSATVSSMTSNRYQEQISSISEAIENDFEISGTGYSYAVLQNRSDQVT